MHRQYQRRTLGYLLARWMQAMPLTFLRRLRGFSVYPFSFDVHKVPSIIKLHPVGSEEQSIEHAPSYFNFHSRSG